LEGEEAKESERPSFGVGRCKYSRPDAEEQKRDTVLKETKIGWRTRGGWGTKFSGMKLLKFSHNGQE
jgi:hypothetical protein